MTQQNPFSTDKAAGMNDPERFATPQDKMIRQAVLVGYSLIGNGVLFFALGLYLALTTGAWQPITFAAWSLLYEVIHFFGISYIRRGRMNQGGWTFLVTNIIGASLGSMLFVSLGYIAVAYILVTSFFIIRYVMSKDTRISATVVASVGLIIAIAAESIDPAWRQTAQLMLTISPVITAILGIAFIIVIFYQARETINRSLRLKIIVWSGISFFISAAFIIGYAATSLRNEATLAAEEKALDVAHAQAADIQTVLERTLSAGEIFTDSVIIGKTEGVQLNREQVNAMLRQVLKDNPRFVGVDVLFEPNAFDGRDAEFTNTEGSDANGRFLPYWTRGEGGQIQVELLQDYDVSDWYQCPKLTKVPCLIDPYVYPVQGQDVWMTSLVIPFVYENTFLGITGIDTPVTFLQELADSVDIFDGAGKIAIISNNGTLLGVTGQPELIGQPVTAMHEHFSTNDYQMIKNGVATLQYSPGNEDLEVFVPIHVGKTVSPWAVNVIIPRAAFLADATRQMWQMVGIGGGLLIISLIILSYAAGQLTQPIEKITDVAKQVTAGNLEVVADVQAVDETGILAEAFNTMVSQLRDTLANMEHRIEERTENLELAAEVGRAVSQVRERSVMLKEACDLILEQFDLYYVQVYLTDATRSNLVLEAGTGEVGAQLLERGHSLPLSLASINGRAAFGKRPVVIPNTTLSPDFRKNPLLPDTRGEMAVPLVVGNQVVGVLDMQTRYPDKLTEELLPAYEALAGQLAVAIQNANLLAETEQARAEVEAQARRQVRTNWGEHLDGIHKPEQFGFVFDRNEVLPISEMETEPSQEDDKAVSSPIYLSGEELGSLVVEIDDEKRKEQTSELVTIVARQVAQQIENLRLLESAERFRQEAEEASRRQTAEGWQAYVASRTTESLGYLYDRNEVRPHSNGQDDATALTLPLKVRDEAIGKMAVQGLSPNDRESFELANAVAERLSAHIESLRQYDQTQSALSQSEKLFEGSRRLTESTDLQGLVAAVVETLGIPVVNRAVLGVFDYGDNEEFLSMTVTANWWNGLGHEATPIGTHYPVEVFQTVSLFASTTPVFFNDAFHDPRADETTLALAKRQNLRAVAILPLFSGARQVGVLMLEAEEPHNFRPEETRLFTSLAPQITTVLENRRQFERAQKQAEREGLLNTISQKIQSATSVEAVLQIAARELGHALGAPMTIAQLSIKDQN